MIDIKVPTVGESISEVTLLKWNKKDGDYVERDEVIAELESEKATFEVNAEQAGVIKLSDIKEGDTLKIGDLLASIDESASKSSGNGKPVTAKETEKPKEENNEEPQPEVKASPKTATKKQTPKTETKQDSKAVPVAVTEELKASPVASAMIADKKLDPKTVTPTGPLGKIL